MLPYLIYTLVIVLLYPRAKKSRWFRLVMFLVTICFIGFRKDVGTDYESYADYYNSYADFFDIGYTALSLFLHSHGCDVAVLFFIMAALSYGILYLAVELNNDIDKGTTSLLLCLLTITTSVNGIRQFLAVCTFMLSYCCIKNRKFLLFLVCIGAGALFHESVLILIPFYFFADKHLPAKFYIIIYIASFVFTTMSLQEIMGPFTNFLSENEDEFHRYNRYILGDSYSSSYFSLGVFVGLLNYIILLFFSIRLKLYEKYPIIFNMFFVLCIVYNMRIASPLFNRIQMYFTMYTSYLLPLVIKRLNVKTAKPLIVYYTISFTSMSIKYIFFTPISRMAVYHDVFGLF